MVIAATAGMRLASSRGQDDINGQKWNIIIQAMVNKEILDKGLPIDLKPSDVGIIRGKDEAWWGYIASSLRLGAVDYVLDGEKIMLKVLAAVPGEEQGFMKEVGNTL